MRNATIPSDVMIREKEIRFTIPRVPLSRNKLDQLHWAERHRISQLWKTEVYFAAEWSGVAPKVKRHVSIRVVWAKRRLDQDNLSGALKCVIDALKTNGLIFNDSPKWLTAEYTQDLVSKAGGKPRTEIAVKGLP